MTNICLYIVNIALLLVLGVLLPTVSHAQKRACDCPPDQSVMQLQLPRQLGDTLAVGCCIERHASSTGRQVARWCVRNLTTDTLQLTFTKVFVLTCDTITMSSTVHLTLYPRQSRRDGDGGSGSVLSLRDVFTDDNCPGNQKLATVRVSSLQIVNVSEKNAHRRAEQARERAERDAEARVAAHARAEARRTDSLMAVRPTELPPKGRYSLLVDQWSHLHRGHSRVFVMAHLGAGMSDLPILVQQIDSVTNKSFAQRTSHLFSGNWFGSAELWFNRRGTVEAGLTANGFFGSRKYGNVRKISGSSGGLYGALRLGWGGPKWRLLTEGGYGYRHVSIRQAPSPDVLEIGNSEYRYIRMSLGVQLCDLRDADKFAFRLGMMASLDQPDFVPSAANVRALTVRAFVEGPISLSVEYGRRFPIPGKCLPYLPLDLQNQTFLQIQMAFSLKFLELFSQMHDTAKSTSK